MSVDFVKWNLRSTLARFCGVLARSPCQCSSTYTLSVSYKQNGIIDRRGAVMRHQRMS